MDEIGDERLREICGEAVYALRIAHKIIERTIEGKHVEFNQLENYLAHVDRLIEAAGYKGGLIAGVLDKLGEMDWYEVKLNSNDAVCDDFEEH